MDVPAGKQHFIRSYIKKVGFKYIYLYIYDSKEIDKIYRYI